MSGLVEGEVWAGHGKDEEVMDLEMTEPISWTPGDLFDLLTISLDWLDATIFVGAETKEVVEQIALKLKQIQPRVYGQYADQAAAIKN